MTTWIALSRTQHAKAHWRPCQGFEFAAQQQTVPISIVEIGKALSHFVLVFIEEGEGHQLSVLADVGEGRNLFVGSKSNWLASYVPESLRGYPFALATYEGGEKVLSIDESHLSEGSDCLPLFQNDGSLAPEVTELLNLLNNNEQNRKVTQAACASLKAAGLIEPWPLKVQSETSGQTVALQGVNRINFARLNEIDAGTFEGLRKNGALTVAYAQLFSMNQTDQFGPLIRQYKQERLDVPSILLNDEGSMNFDAF